MLSVYHHLDDDNLPLSRHLLLTLYACLMLRTSTFFEMHKFINISKFIESHGYLWNVTYHRPHVNVCNIIIIKHITHYKFHGDHTSTKNMKY